MNLQDIIRRVQRSFGDSAEAQVYVTDIIDWVNDGCLVLARDLELLKDKVRLTVDATTAKEGWPLPADYVKSASVIFNKIPMTYVNYQDVREYTNNPPSDPGWYYIWGGYLFLYPVAITYGTEIVEHTYIRMPRILQATGDTPEIAAVFHLDLVRYCLMRAKELNEDEAAIGRINEEFVMHIAESKFTSNPSINSYPVVRDYVGDFW